MLIWKIIDYPFQDLGRFLNLNNADKFKTIEYGGMTKKAIKRSTNAKNDLSAVEKWHFPHFLLMAGS